MYLKGKIRVDKKTKELVKRLKVNEIAVINHKDLDEIAALAIVKSKPKLVINASPSITGKYPNLGPLRLLEAGIPLLDEVGQDFFTNVIEGQEIEVRDNAAIINGQKYFGTMLNKEEILNKLKVIRQNYQQELTRFVYNTLEYAAKEIELIAQKMDLPPLKTKLAKKHVLIVVRGHNYQEDLKTIRPYIQEVRPVLIGVDGGADALLENGYKPDLIVGDMDSVTDKALKSGAELIVHAYSNGYAPGLSRLQKLNLHAQILPAPGTSEDIAMLLAYESGADLIVAVGSHSNAIDFFDKGRQGMSSTFLVRLKVGTILVDAKGVSKLYRGRVKVRDMVKIIAAALIPIFIVLMVSPVTHQLLRLMFIRFRLLFSL